jgi:hypothetical protein
MTSRSKIQPDLKMNTLTTTQELDNARNYYRNERLSNDVLKVMDAATEELTERGVVERAIKPGATAPDFILPDAQGQPVRLFSLLKNGPVVLVFYRGGWPSASCANRSG